MATPQSVQITIAGADKTLWCGNVVYRTTLNDQAEATFDVTDPTGAYAPAEDAVVEIRVGGTLRFAGEIADTEALFLGELVGLVTRVTVHDHAQRAWRGMINAIYPAQTLKATLQDLTGVGSTLAAQSITLAAGQATGPSLGVVTAPWWKPVTLLSHLTTIAAGYVWRIDASKVLEMWLVGSRSTSVTLSLANGNIVSASWRRQRYEYRTRQWVAYGPSEVRWVADAFVGDGATRQFVLRYGVAVVPGTVTVTPGGTVYPVGTYGVDSMQWTYDAATGSVRQDVGYSALTGGQTLTVDFQSQFPNYLIAIDATEEAARGEWNGDLLTLPDVTTYAEAYATALAVIRQSTPRPVMPAIATTNDAMVPGSTVTVDLPAIGLSSEVCLIQAVETRLEPAGTQVIPVHTLTLLGGDELRSSDYDLWRRIVSGTGSSSSGGSVGGGGGGSTTTILSGSVEGDLGGTRLNGVTHTTWAPVREHRDWECPADGTYRAFVEVWTMDAGTSVTPRVYDVTAASAAATDSAAQTSTSPVKRQIPFSGVAGHTYRLEVLPGNTAVDVFGLGKVRT
jgi:hypothetical protein